MLNFTISERIKSTIKEKKLTINDMISNCGLNRNFMYDLSQNKTLKSSETLRLIADYLGCSVDYLLGRTDVLEAPASSDLTGSESELLRSFRSLNAEGREKLTDYADDLVSSPKYKGD